MTIIFLIILNFFNNIFTQLLKYKHKHLYTLYITALTLHSFFYNIKIYIMKCVHSKYQR